MSKHEDKDTRYFIDLDLRSGRILTWDYDDRYKLVVQRPAEPFHHRVYISKGQYNKLEQKHRALSSEGV